MNPIESQASLDDRSADLAPAAEESLGVILYKKMYRIRHAEKLIIRHYSEDDMKTPMHMSMGQEAIAAAVCHALGLENQVYAFYRSHAVYIAKTDDTRQFFAELYGRRTGGSKGKAGSMHLCCPEKGHWGTSAVVGGSIPAAVGTAFANKYKRSGLVSCVFFGDGATEEGGFWESLNAACVLKVPVLFVCEDNGLAVNSAKDVRQGFRSIRDVVSQFECDVFSAESPDVEKIYEIAMAAISSIRRTGRPVFFYHPCYRYLEHVGVNEDFGVGYRPKDEYLEWLERDSLVLQRRRLIDDLEMGEDAVAAIEGAIEEEAARDLAAARSAPFPSSEELHSDIFVPSKPASPPPETGRKLSYGLAIREGLIQEMERDRRVFLYGIGIPTHANVFGSVEGLQKRFGSDRVFDTPLSEDAMTGFGLGAALSGLRPVHTHIRVDFLILAMNQLANMVSSWRYGTGGKMSVPLVIRAVVGRGWGQGYQHSKSLHSIFAHIPGLKVVLPTTAYDAKGLLISAIRDDNPVLIIEHRWLYWAEKEVPEEPYAIALGEGHILRPGKDITVVATSWMNVEAMKAADVLSRVGVSVEIIDPRTISPLDEPLIVSSVRKTGHCVVADNDWLHCGFGAEVAARVSEKCFGQLKSPVKRIGWVDTPCPTTRPLENQFYPNAVNIIREIESKLGLPPTDLSKEDFYSHENRFKGPF